MREKRFCSEKIALGGDFKILLGSTDNDAIYARFI